MQFRNVLFPAVALLVGLGQLTSCRQVDDGDEDENTEIGVTDNIWSSTEIQTTGPITSVYASDFEVFVFTPNEFVRAFQLQDELNEPAGLQVKDQRQFLADFRTLGFPAVNNLVFSRGAVDVRTGQEIVEFQLVQYAGGVRQVLLDTISLGDGIDEPLGLEYRASTVGAFSRDSRVYAQPVVRRSSRKLAVLLFELDYFPGFNRFKSITPFALVDLPDVIEDDRAVSTIRFIDGFFYVATKQGGYRIGRTGSIERVIDRSTGLKDIFKFEGEFFAARDGVGDLLRSDDGIFFGPSRFVQDFGLMQVFGEQVVTQRFEGWPYFVSDGLASRPDSLKLNREFSRAQDRYFGLDRLNGRFYMGLDRTLYSAEALQVNPE